MRLICLMVLVIFLAGCAQGKYQDFYKDFTSADNRSNIQLLARGEEPKLYRSDDLDRDIKVLEAKRYVKIGRSSFYGELEDTANAVAQAKRIGATVVLVRIGNTQPRKAKSTLSQPRKKMGFSLAKITPKKAGPVGHEASVNRSDVHANVAALSTLDGTHGLPAIDSQGSFDQVAIYLVKDTKEYRVGVVMIDLDPELRSRLKRDTGAVIDNILENSSAFHSKVLVDDVLIAIDGSQVTDAAQAMELLNGIDSGVTATDLTVLRKGSETKIHVEFD